MTIPLWFHNLSAYSIQISALALMGMALHAAFRLRLPKVSLLYWQGLLFACLVLPFLEPWKQIPIVSEQDFESVTVEMGPLVNAPSHAAFPFFKVAALILILGIAARLLWTGLGLCRLRRHKRRAVKMNPTPIVVTEIQSRLSINATFLLSSEVSGPITYGALHPVVLFPDRFVQMDAACQRAIACHELLHVRRRDWVFNLLEEIILAVLWFHPVVWWVVGRIRLAREQTVDREVLQWTEARKPYLQALVEIATGPEPRRALLAPRFMQEGQLVQRVALMLKEVSMSRSRIILSLVAVATILLATAGIAVSAFPLKAIHVGISSPALNPYPSPAQDQGVGSTTSEEKQADTKKPGKNAPHLEVVHKVAPIYPPLAKLAHVEGKVVLRVSVEKDGTVSNVEVVSGHPLLVEAAVKAVRQWQFASPESNSVLTDVKVNFTLANEKSDEEKLAEIKAQLQQVQSGDQSRLTDEQRQAQAKLRALLESLAAQANENQKVKYVQTKEQQLALLKAQKAELDAQIAEAEQALNTARNQGEGTFIPMPIKKVQPVYPPEAKKAHIQGVVILRATLDEDGMVTEIETVSGPPALVKAARDAVRKWQFEKPFSAPVVVSVEINFTLTD